MKLEELAGRHLMIGLESGVLTSEWKEHCLKIQPAGFIFFRRNFRSAAHFKQLLTDLEDLLGRRFLAAVDHEGGRVIHLGEGATIFPDNLALGMTGRVEFAKKQGGIEARELRRLGIDLNLAPTLDVLTPAYSPNIGIRSYGRDPLFAGKMGAARIEAMQARGLSACAKHFPGQGQSPLDAHLSLPVLPTTWEELEDVHLPPFFKAVEAGVHTVMTSHPVYPNLDSEKVPATFSRRIVRELLRSELGFEGVILTDDLEMGALKNLCPIGESASRAVRAGHDLLLVCRDTAAQREVYDALIESYKTRRLSLSELEKSVERIETLIAYRQKRFEGGDPVREKDGEALAGQIALKAIHVRGSWPEDKDGPESASIAVIFPKLSSLENLIYIEPELLDEAGFLKANLGELGLVPSSVSVVPLSLDKKTIEDTLPAARKSSVTLFFCYDAHLDAGTRELMEKVMALSPHPFFVFLRDPYDEEFLKKKAPYVHCFGFRKVQIQAALHQFAHFLSGVGASGRSPLHH